MTEPSGASRHRPQRHQATTLCLMAGHASLQVRQLRKNSATKNIEQTLRQSLLRTITYDKVDGLDGSSWLHQPSRGLLFVSYQSCCWANSGQGLIGVGGDSSIPETPSWLDWHEYGHQFQMGWSWVTRRSYRQPLFYRCMLHHPRRYRFQKLS